MCEWWPGQKGRLPVAMVAPVGKACTHLVIENMGLQPRVPALAGAKLRLLKEHGVGLVFILILQQGQWGWQLDRAINSVHD